MKMADGTRTPREQVEDKIIDLFSDRADDLVRLLFYFEKSSTNGTALPPAIRVLNKLVSNTTAFIAHANRLITETKTVENNGQYYDVIDLLHRQMIALNENPSEYSEGTDLENVATNIHQTTAFPALASAWGKIPANTQTEILSMVQTVLNKKNTFINIEELASLASITGENLVNSALTLPQLPWEAIRSIKAWYRGEISGKRCAKNIVDTFVTLAAGVSGGVGGAAFGSSFLLGWGTLIGGVVGGLLSSAVAEAATVRLTQKVFSLPRSAAIDNAFRFFGLDCAASNTEINKAYRRMCRERNLHADGGSHDEFIEVQVQLQIIKEARGYVA